MRLQVVGDELHLEGMILAVFAQSGIPATYMQWFIDNLENGTLFENTEMNVSQDELKDRKAEETLEVLHSAFKRVERGGLLRWTDVQAVVQKFVDGDLE